MADKPKLASSFEATRISVTVSLAYVAGAIKHCEELGLQPSVYGYENGRILFRVVVPKTAETAFMKELPSFHGGAVKVTTIRLMCPLSAV
jgi:hypothetical protein